MKRYTVTFSSLPAIRVLMPDTVPMYDGWPEGEKRPVEPRDALDRAIQKVWGKSAFWWADSGLAGYGQVCRPVPQKLGGGNNCITSRIGVDIEEGWQ